MNLSEGLSELKILKTRIARAIEVREKTLKYRGKKPEKTYRQLTEEIKSLSSKATELKFKIMNTNIASKVNGVSLQLLILQQGDIRSEISALKRALGDSKGSKIFRGSGVFDDGYDDKAKFQVSRFEIEDEIKKLESEKRKIDSIIQSANWRTLIK